MSTSNVLGEPILKLENISKIFPGCKALDNVSLNLMPGEVHALLGENGSGKSTLIKIISGVQPSDEGEMYFAGQKQSWRNPKEAQLMGIATIHQEIDLIPNMDVAENIFLNKEPLLGKTFLIDYPTMYEKTAQVLKRVGVEISSKTIVGRLSTAEQQLIQIAKAMAMEMRILILDEPTAALPAKDVERLFEIIKRLQKEGIAILYVSHRLEEIEILADRVTVLRDGRLIDTKFMRETNLDEIIRLMVGKNVEEVSRETTVQPGVKFSVKGLSVRKGCRDVSFDLHEGEILGIAGLVGSGRSEVAAAIGGGKKMEAGTIVVHGKEIKNVVPSVLLENGVGYLPCERKTEGLATLLTVKDNITLASLKLFSKALGFLSTRALNTISQDYVKKLGIKITNLEQKVGSLSGGNQQKVVLAKILSRGSDILVFDEPTRGIDVGARREIYHLLDELAQEGKSLILSSTDLPELLGNCDRILAMYKGRIVAEFPKGTSKEQLLRAIFGQDLPKENRESKSGLNPETPGTKENYGAKPKRTLSSGAFLKFFSGMPLLVVILIAFFGFTAEGFFTLTNLDSFLKQFSMLWLLAAAQSFALITKGIDLSIGSTEAVASVVLGLVAIHYNMFFGIIAAVVVAFAIGYFNGAISGGINVEPFIVTLGMMYVGRGMALWVTDGQPVFGFPLWFSYVADGKFLSIPIMLIIAVVFAVAAQIVLTRTRFGRNLVAIGGNEGGANITGVPVARARWYGYVVSAVLSCIVGILLASRLFSGQPTIGNGSYVEAMAAAVIGGVSVSGGRGDIFGIISGVLIIGLIGNGLNILHVPAYTQLVIMGVVLIVSVIIDRLRVMSIEKNM